MALSAVKLIKQIEPFCVHLEIMSTESSVIEFS